MLVGFKLYAASAYNIWEYIFCATLTTALEALGLLSQASLITTLFSMVDISTMTRHIAPNSC